MKENLLQFIWKLKLFPFQNLKSTTGDDIFVLFVGAENLNSGPDFLHAKIRINEQLWVGNVEIHVKASDWYLHHHEIDENYNAVILHVVWEHDVAVFSNSNVPIPTLELKNYCSPELMLSYRQLFSKKYTWINCEKLIGNQSEFLINNWLERLFFERLENKSVQINLLLNNNNQNWEATLFVLLTKNFGSKINGNAFFDMAKGIDFKLLRKISQNALQLEALLFGQANLLDVMVDDVYFQQLKSEYAYLKSKFKLLDNTKCKMQFFKLRPINFPTIRLSQLANLFATQQNLFSKILETENLKDYYNLFNCKVSDFWETHYTFETSSKKSSKKLTKSFIDLLLINTVIPLKFLYLKTTGKLDAEKFLNLCEQIKPEQNEIISKFKNLHINASNAFETQALLQLKNEYCTKQRCLHCAIGKAVLTS